MIESNKNISVSFKKDKVSIKPKVVSLPEYKYFHAKLAPNTPRVTKQSKIGKNVEKLISSKLLVENEENSMEEIVLVQLKLDINASFDKINNQKENYSTKFSVLKDEFQKGWLELSSRKGELQ